MTPDDAATAETPAPPLTRREMRALRESGVLPVVGAETATVVAAEPPEPAPAPGPAPEPAAAPDPAPEPAAAADPDPEVDPVAQPEGAADPAVPADPALPATIDLRAPLAPEPTPSDVLTARAGRNVPVAVGVGVGLVVALVASLFLRKEAFGLLALAAVLGALIELRAALARQSITLPVLPIMVGAVGMFVSAYLAGPEALLVSFVLTAGGVVVWCALDGGGLRVLRNATAAIFVAAYVPFLASFLALALAADDGAWRVLIVVVLVVACDTGGWAAGVTMGRHALAPSISPKKSWEGLAGSTALAVLVGSILVPLVLDATWWVGALVGVLTVVAGLVGDLGESLIKRDLGMKDMGDSIPGHGGILDRVDALLVAAPVVVTALALAAPAL